MKNSVWIVIVWNVAMSSLVSAAVLTDTFNDNTLGTMWGTTKIAEQCPETSFGLIEASQRLEFRAALPPLQDGIDLNWGMEFCYSNAWWLDVSSDFSFKIAYHHPLTSGSAGLMLGIAPSTVHVDYFHFGIYLSAECLGGQKYFYFGGQGVSDEVLRSTTDGTLYISYVSAIDTLYLSYTGYGAANAVKTVSGLLKGEWGGVPIYLGFAGAAFNGTTVTAGQLYLDNFVLDSGVQIVRPTNVTCDQAIALTSGIAKTGSTLGTDGSGLWYSFAPEVNGTARITVTPSPDFDAVLGVNESCEGSEIDFADSGASGDEETLSISVTAGMLYPIYVAGYNGSEGNFSIRVDFYPQPANDDCSQAIALTAGVARDGSTLGSVDSVVWYSFTAGGNGEARVRITTPGATPPLCSIYDACEGNMLPVDYYTEDESTLVIFDAIAGQKYWIYVETWTLQNFSIRADFYATPANVNCSQAIALTSGLARSGTTLGAWDSNVWYSFTPGISGMARVTLTPAEGTSLERYEVYDACDGNAVPFDFQWVDAEGALILFDFQTVVGGTYRIGVGSAESRGAFSIRINLFPLPINDFCDNAIALLPNATRNGYTIGAGDLDVWYSFTAAVIGTAMITVTPSDNSFNPSLSVYEICGEEAIVYVDDGYEGESETVSNEVAAGEKYLICVSGYSPGTFTIRVDFSPPGVAGDLCSQPIVLTKGIVRSATTVGATGYSTCTCSENDTRDVWFKYTPSEDEPVRVIVTEVGNFDSSVSVYNFCGGDELVCADRHSGGEGEELLFDGWTGESYWIRVAGYDGQTGAFSIVCKPLIFCPVSGVVSDKNSGAGIGWIEIEFSSDLWGYEYTPATTDENGYYEVSLPEGKHEVSTWDIDGYADIFSKPVDISDGMGSLNIQLAPAAVLEITVVDSVTAETVTDQFGIRVVLDTPEGYHSIEGDLDNLPEGLYQVQLRPYDEYGPYPGSESWVYLHEGQHTQYLYPALPGIEVEGYVVCSGSVPLVGATVYYSGKDGIGYTVTDYDGIYHVNLPAGTYGFAAFYSNEWDFVWAQSTWVSVTIPDTSEPVTGPDLTVYDEENLLSISGTIQNSGNFAKAGEFDVVVFQKDIVPSPENGYSLLWDGFWLANNTLDAAGPFEIGDLPPDTYDVYLGIVSWNEDSLPSFAVRGRIRNIAAGTSNVTLAYTSVGSTVQGRIRDWRGNVILGAEILLQTPAGDFAGWTRSDSRGQYLFNNVPAGSYTVSAVHRHYITGGTAITVAATSSTVTAASLKLTPTGISEGADLNGDGYVNFDDFTSISGNWSKSQSDAGDFDSSGTTDMDDLARMVEYWLGRSIWLGEMPKFPDLIGYWSMDDNAADTTVLDAGDNRLDGTAQQNTATLTRPGKIGTALAFNGTTDYVDCGNGISLQERNILTVSAWINGSDYSATTKPYNVIVCGHQANQNFSWGLRIDSGVPKFLIRTGAYYSANATGPVLSVGQWYHIAGVWDRNGGPNNLRIYVNGELKGQTTLNANMDDATVNVWIGRATYPGINQYFKGIIDDVRVYNTALSVDEISALCGASLAKPTISPNGGTFTDSIQVTLSCSTADAAIRYTLDGTDPTSSSTLYMAPFTVNTSCTVKAKAFKNGLYDSETASAAFVIKGLMAHWSMDDNAADKTVLDTGDNHLDGVAQQNTATLTRPGKIGMALTFNGTTDFVDCGNGGVFQERNTLTVSAWINGSDYSATTKPYNMVVCGHKTNQDFSWGLRIDSGVPKFFVKAGNYYSADATGSGLSVGQWYHLAGVWDRNGGTNNLKIYINGELKGQRTLNANMDVATVNVWIGRATYPGLNQYFKGAIDDVMLFDRALSGDEILALLDNQ